MPPLIRRQPLSERIKALLNPYDFLLWLAEEMHESAIDEKLRDWTVPIGIAANLAYMIARANSTANNKSRGDDLFGDYDGRNTSGWFVWLSSFTAYTLATLSVANAVYLFTRTRKYRLFESNVEVAPTTPSARRVKVDSSPMSNSPLSYFSAKLAAATSATARALPDGKTDVWELSIWDPKSLHLSLFSLFSPGHVLVYWLFLPTTSTDPRPSVTILTTILLTTLLSAQLLLFKSFFEAKARDEKVLHKEVMNEYDTKYVHPALNRPVRDVATQSKESTFAPGVKTAEVQTYTPTTMVNRGFRINPNPSYARHLGDNVDTTALYAESPAYRGSSSSGSRSASGAFNSPTPLARSSTTGSLLGGNSNYAARQMMRDVGSGSDNHGGAASRSLQQQQQRQSQYPPSARPSTTERDRTSTFPRPGSSGSGVGGGDGGSLGVFSHAASPLRKSSSGNLLRGKSVEVGRGSDRLGSPLKRVNLPVARDERYREKSREKSVGRERDVDEELRARMNGLRDSRPY